MPTEIIIHSQKFYSQLKSGFGFSTPTDGTDNLTGSVGERIKMISEIDVGWYFIATLANTLTVENIAPSDIKLRRMSGSWITDDNFNVGDEIVIKRWDGYTFITSATVNTVSDLQMQITVAGGTMPDAEYGADAIYVMGVTALTALIYKYGLVGNNETFNVLSKISNNEQAWYASNIDHVWPPPYATSTMLRVGTYLDWMTEAAAPTVTFDQTIGTLPYYQRFLVTHEFIIAPWYIEDWQQNFIDGTTPSLLAGLASLKYVFECEFRTVLSNPNTSKIARIENNLGSVAWFDENYNGFYNNYSIDSITYKDTGSSVACDALQKGARTTATITISKIIGSFNAGDPCGVMLSICTQQADYQQKLTTAEDNFLFDDAVNNEGAAFTAGTNGLIKYYTAAITAGKLVMEVQVEFNSAQQLQLTEGMQYIIGAQVADDTLFSGNSDKVILMADYNNIVQTADIANLFYVTAFEMFQHFVTDPTATSGTTKLDAWNEDGVTFKFDMWLDLYLSARLDALKFVVLAYKASTGAYFILDEYAINLNNVIVSGGIQQINIDTLRGYKLRTTDYMNRVVMSTEALVATKQYYRLYIGQKTPWQAWLQNTDADTIFYDNNEPQNNLNYKTSNYSSLNGYEIKFGLLANVYGTSPLGLSGNTSYLILSPDIKVYDYALPTTWTGTIETYDETGTTNLGGVIRTDADTLMRITWVRSSAFNAGYNFWAIHRIEESGELGTDIYEFSSLIPTVAINLLKALPGETYLKMTVTPGTKTVVTECLIDYTKLDGTKNYKISGRLDDGTAVPYAPTGLVTEDGTLFITEDGTAMEVE